MNTVAKRRMSADEFLAWARQQPEGERYELVAGEVVSMAPERVEHNRAKLRAAVALERALERTGLPCEVFTDGLSLRIDDDTVYEPDAMVRCGPEVEPDATAIDDPMIVVEVISPSSRRVDVGAKLAGYMSVPSVRHYVVVDPARRTVIHHARGSGDVIETRILTTGLLALDPPGIVVPVEDLFRA